MFRSGFSFLFCATGILCMLCLCAGSLHTNKCVKAERQALLKLKDGVIYGRTMLSSWNGENCCEWKGISCDNLTGHITSLDLYAQYLGGKLDSSICELQHLTSLNLSQNSLKGKIPSCIGSLDQLMELKLNFNEFVSVIPPTLGNLSNLQTLDFRNNYYLAANDLTWLSRLSNLRNLYLESVNLGRVDDWLSPISKIPSLSELNLMDCGLRQVNPEFISHLNSSMSLKSLSLGRNNLNSSILSWVLNAGKVLTYLDLSSNSLHNTLDAFANMTSLRGLSLSNNELEGSIPKSFRSLCQLENLDLYSNKLSGRLSDNIQQLCCDDLEMLDLSNNSFSSGPLPDFSCFSSLNTLQLRNANVVGPLPPSLGNFPNLAYLDLSHNQLNGTISESLGDFPNLAYLDLSQNQLNGSLPDTFGRLSNLKTLYLSSNKLNGTISEALMSALYSLDSLDVGENSLSFNLSSNWIPPFQLTRLEASSCNLGPKFPTWLKNQTRLLQLDISNNGISYSFPEWFWNLSPHLLYLNVSYNKLWGVLPKSLPVMEVEGSGILWDFSFNNLSGPLPSFPELTSLYLSNNMFSGSISTFCASSPSYLTNLDLSSNLLVGPLSDCWGNFQSLKFLSLAKNSLSGKIPKSLGTLQQIESIHLNNNNFSGEIPSLTLCSNLTFIDFGDNNLQGTLPAWVGHNLRQLIVLRLQANKFQGNIPASLCNLLFLQVLDLSGNNITGEIPQCLSDITALSDLKFPRKFLFHHPLVAISDFNPFMDKAILAWKGEYREYGKNLGLLTAIDLSFNHLIGEIPQSITKLVALIVLNLSGNNLTGFIPNSIGHMERLESLDLSKNNLCGRMPASISKLTLLSYMNLSFNNLSGKIPLSTQLQSFDPSTYVGNSGLCGPPLTNHCPGDVIPPIESPGKHVTTEDEDEEELIGFGFYVSLGLGFCVGFWGVCGTLTIKASWRHAYFRFFNNINEWIHVTLVVFAGRMKRRYQVQD